MIDSPSLPAYKTRFTIMEKDIDDGQEWLWCEQRQLALKIALVCTYGYSGCPVNRFANVRVFQEINRIARETLVKSMNIAMERGFEVIYGDSDSLFVKRPKAAGEDYEDLAKKIEVATGLAIRFERHFRFLVLLPRASDAKMKAARRYYGKLMDGGLFYRGIEMRRRDTPPYVKQLQERIMKVLFDAESAWEILETRLPHALRIAREAIEKIRRCQVSPEELIVEKRVSRPLWRYDAKLPHVVAAELEGRVEGSSRFLYVDADASNPYMRVMPASLINGDHKGYDKGKYAELAYRAIRNLLNPLISSPLNLKDELLSVKRVNHL